MNTVNENWKYATFGLGVLVVAQFFWWNKKAPEVLKLGYGK
jgi:hypothetical protein